MLLNLIYSSQSVAEPGSPAFIEAVKDIRKEASTFNAAHGISGSLLCFGGTFLQLLEGEQEAVSDLYARIRRDPRHRDVRTLWNSEHKQRMFSAWSMVTSMERIAEHYGVQSKRLAFLGDLLPLVTVGSFRIEMLRDLLVTIAKAFDEEARATSAEPTRIVSGARFPS